MEIKLISSVIFVKDIQSSRQFYESVLGQTVLMDHGPNVGFVGGFALWQREHAHQVIFGRQFENAQAANQPDAELYFETEQLDEVCRRLETAGVETIHPLVEQPWGQRVIRFYDPDRHMIDLGEPMSAVIQRFKTQGLSLEEIAQRTFMPLEVVKQMAAV